MQERLFHTLVAAGAIDHVTFWRNPKHGGAWSVFGYGLDNRDLGVMNAIETARGGVRTWASLDTAHAWVMGAGWDGDIEISATRDMWQHSGPDRDLGRIQE